MLSQLQSLSTALSEAESAYHALMTGTAVREVRDQNGEAVVYTQANKTSLSQYIADLRRQIATLQNPSAQMTSIPTPLRPFFL